MRFVKYTAWRYEEFWKPCVSFTELKTILQTSNIIKNCTNILLTWFYISTSCKHVYKFKDPSCLLFLFYSFFCLSRSVVACLVYGKLHFASEMIGKHWLFYNIIYFVRYFQKNTSTPLSLKSSTPPSSLVIPHKRSFAEYLCYIWPPIFTLTV